MARNSGEDRPDVSIIVVSFNTCDVTRRCLQHVQEYATEVRHEVYVVDNASTDGSADMVARDFPWVHLIRMSENKGFAAGNNVAIKKASGRYLLLLNSDAFLNQGVLADTIHYMDRNPATGVLGCKLTCPDGSMQASARMLPSALNKILHVTGLAARFPKSPFFGRVDYTWWNHSEPRSVGWVVGAYFLIRASMTKEVGFIDERYFLYFEEIDYCLAVRKAGWDVVFYPYAEVVHLGGQSAVATDQPVSGRGRQLNPTRVKSEYRYWRKFHGWSRVLTVAAIEFFWDLIVLLKNGFANSAKAQHKRKEAMAGMKLIFSTLWNDRLGKGARAG